MNKKKIGFAAKALICVLLVSFLYVLPSCKKSSGDNESTAQQQAQPAADANQVMTKDTNEPVAASPAPTPAPDETAASDDTQNEGWVPIEIELPRPMFVGTPQDAKVDNLEKPREGPRPPFLAPPGTTNVALGKPVTSSDPEPIIGELEQITDGDKEASDGSYVELGPMVQYVTIDLEDTYNIYAVVVWHYHMQAHIYFDVVVQVADDPDFITNVRTLFNNDIDNSAGLGVGEDMHYSETNEGKLIDAKGVKARYVRLYSNGNSSDDLNRYIEVAVYGTPVEE
jgi:hypothetical protein